MAGRPRKKPEYNPELQFNNFLQELRDAYEEADSLRSLADELNISLLKLRKLLITADVFTSDICTEIKQQSIHHIDPSFLRTTITVLNNIFISSPMFQFVIYSLSRRTTSSKSVMSLRPLTCHIPVIPGLIANLARWCSS